MKTGLYVDEKVVSEVTHAINKAGVTCLQSHRLAATEEAHVAELLRFFDPAQDSRILDLGCGTGAVADIMKKLRPDLRFTLLNHSQAQLDMANNKHFKVCADFHDIPRLPALIDSAMMLWALGHGKLRAVMSEVSRVLPIGGVFFIYDLVSARGAPELQEKMHYTAYPPLQIVRSAYDYGMVLTKRKNPLTLTSHMTPFLDTPTFNAVFEGASPMLFRFCKVQ